MSQPALADRPSASGTFPTTHWSAILAAGQDVGTRADSALAELCRTYWYPLYAFARCKGRQPADAQDLTQGFFTHLIEAGLVRKADPRKGRFRSFLLGCFTTFLASEARSTAAEKRGGGAHLVPIDLERAERCFAAEPSSTATPERLFDLHWAVAVLNSAMALLETEFDESGRAALFQELMPTLEGDNDLQTYDQIAQRLGTTAGTIKVTVHRLRQRYRELIRFVVSQTVNDPMDVEAELAHLMAALRG
ncbi:MAG TPA: sigma-70 family RNA polymerase sigma factor [Verrucomicrobiae bacterium]